MQIEIGIGIELGERSNYLVSLRIIEIGFLRPKAMAISIAMGEAIFLVRFCKFFWRIPGMVRSGSKFKVEGYRQKPNM